MGNRRGNIRRRAVEETHSGEGSDSAAPRGSTARAAAFERQRQPRRGKAEELVANHR
jgi:hypothetical protein